MARTTRGSSASPAKGSTPTKARVVATPGATVASPRKVGRPSKAESNSAAVAARGRQQQQEIPTPSMVSNGKSVEASTNDRAGKNGSASATATANAGTTAAAPSGEGKRFSCPYCGQAFSRKYDMQKHSRKHTGDKPYKCGVCGRQFVQVGRWVATIIDSQSTDRLK